MYLCGKCIETHRLVPSREAWRTSDGLCESCWKGGGLVWVDTVNKNGWRGEGMDPDWLEAIKTRPEGESMEQATERFVEEFTKKPGTASP